MSLAAPGAAPASGLRAAGVAALLLLPAAGCGGDEADRAAVPDSVYVEAMARLVLLDTAVSPTLEPALSGAALDSARDRVLELWGVDAEALLAFARERGDEPDRMEAVWRRVYELSGALKDEEWRPLPDSLDPLAGDTLPGAAGGPSAGPADTGAIRPDTAPSPGAGGDGAGGGVR